MQCREGLRVLHSMRLPFRCYSATSCGRANSLKGLYAAFGRAHASEALASAADFSSIFRKRAATTSDNGRHALGGNGDATSTAFNCGLCTGGNCIAFLTQLGHNRRNGTQYKTNATQLRLAYAATATERFELAPGFQSSASELWMTCTRPGGAVWPDAWTFHAKLLASDSETRLSARSGGCATQTLLGTQQTQRTQQGRNAYEDHLAETQRQRSHRSNSSSRLRQNADNATRPALETRGRTQRKSPYATTPSHHP
jgi:hypothetical protein